MGDRALTTLIDERGKTLATLYTHNGGSGCWMLPKIARWVQDETAGGADLSALAARLLTEASGMDLLPAGTDAGEEHRWTVRVRRDDSTGWRNVPTVTRTEPAGYTPDRWVPGRASYCEYDGPAAILQAAADELRATASRVEVLAAENGWGPEVTAKYLGDPAAIRAEADAFAPATVTA